MKIETNKNGPKLNLLQPDDVRDQASASEVEYVLLDTHGWVKVIPGSFHFYKTAGDRPVPFIQFDMIGSPTGNNGDVYRVEVFPTAIAGLAYSRGDNE